jgi:hypothetical protein
MLWSDIPAFFARFGFEPAGKQYALEILADDPPLPSGSTVRRASPADLPTILALHQAKPIGVNRSLSDLALLLCARPMEIVVMERHGTVVSYACAGKGADFVGWWHELGGSDLDALQLVRAWARAGGPERRMVLLPSYRRQSDLTGTRLFEAQPACLRLILTPAGESDCFVDGLDSI